MIKKVLVTGGAGFLGSHICKNLLENNFYVIVLDNLQTGRLDNIARLINNKNFEFIKHDIIEPINFTNLDFIFNLACPASPPRYQADPIHTTKTSVLGSLNMLELAKKNNARILQASTSEVYGDPNIHPQVENYKGNVNPIGIRACYDEGKRCAESLFFDYQRMYNLQIKVVRIFNTYGPNMDPQDGRVVSNFIMQALQNKPLTMYGDGTQTRSFCYVNDLIDGILKMMFSDQNFYGPVNLGNPVEYNLLELAKVILELTGSKSEIIFKKLPQDDPTKRRPDISLAKKMLNWEPKFDLKLGLQKTINYFEEVLKNENCNSCRRKISRSTLSSST
ncbi:MAG: UDP-glucuronic acid decarboxylase family protein [Candidatus Babeliales bacterium]